MRILLVRARKDPARWVFPKGHIERGESAAEAASREVIEEAGVSGELLRPVGAPVSFMSGSEQVTVQYFLIRMTSEGASPEGREKRWLTPAEAVRYLEFRDARELVDEAARLINAQP